MLDVTFFQNGVRGVHWSLKILKAYFGEQEKSENIKKVLKLV